MKRSNQLLLILGLFASGVIASEYRAPIENIKVYKTELSTLSIQNLSNERIEVDIYGENFILDSVSGIQFECSGYENLELQIKNNDHDYFEVPCKSRVVFTDSFINQNAQRGMK